MKEYISRLYYLP